MEIVKEYLHWQEYQRKRTAGTLRVYRLILDHFMDDVVGSRALDAVSLEELEAYVQRHRTGGQFGKTTRPPSAATISRDTTILRGLYQWARAREHIDRDPSILLHAPTPRNEQPRPISDATWKAWWQAPLPPEGRALLALGFFGGLRRGEMAELRKDQIDVDTIRLVNFRRKGGGEDVLALGTALRIHEEKLPHLLDDAEAVVDVLRGVRVGSGLLLSWLELYEPLNRPQEASRFIDRIGRRLRLPRFTPHQLRHSCATNLLRAGVPLPMVSRYMNHRDVTTTMRYCRIGSDELSDWLANASTPS